MPGAEKPSPFGRFKNDKFERSNGRFAAIISGSSMTGHGRELPAEP
jgi:hypothetical protein